MRDNLHWRRYRQSDVYIQDLDQVVLLQAEQEAALGRPMDMPDLTRRPVLEAWVAERDGRIVGGFYVEAVAEPVFFGRDPLVTASARRIAPQIFSALKERGIRIVRMQCPGWIGEEVSAIAKELCRAGFVSTDGDYRHFMLDLR